MSNPTLPRSKNITAYGTGIPQRVKYTPLGARADALGYRAQRITQQVDGSRAGIAMAGESHTRYNRTQFIQQSREFYRDNAIYRGVIDRTVSYTVGSGFTLQARSKNPEWNAQAEKLWRAFWTGRPEVRGIFSGSRVEQMVCRELLIAGDVLALVVNKPAKLQIIESEQVTKSGITSGVEVDTYGAPSKYWVSGYSKTGVLDSRNATAYSPDSCLFVTDPERPSSIRGVPAAQAAFSMFHRINDVCDSEALAWQLLSRMAVCITREEAAAGAYAESEESGDGLLLADRIQEVDAALIFHGNPGESIKGIDRNIPGQNFPQSLETFMRLLGLPLGLPLEIVLLDWTKSNYSQSRAVLEQAYRTFITRQSLIEEQFHAPLYRLKVAEWMRAGLLPMDDDAFCHEWIKPVWPWIDPLKEVQAHAAKLDRGLTSMTAVCKEMGRERSDIILDRVREITEAIEQSKAIEADTGECVPWQVFAGLEIPQSAAAPEPEVPRFEMVAEKQKEGAAEEGAAPESKTKPEESDDAESAAD